MDSVNERAKELYVNYCGSTEQMARDAVYDEYMQYNVSTVQEREWRAERVAYWMGKLSLQDSQPIIALSQWRAKEALPLLIEMADEGDDHIRLVRANMIWKLAIDYAPGYDEINERAMRTALRTWKSIAEAPVVIVDQNFKPYDGSKPEDFIRAWAREHLEGVPTGKFRL